MLKQLSISFVFPSNNNINTYKASRSLPEKTDQLTDQPADQPTNHTIKLINRTTNLPTDWARGDWRMDQTTHQPTNGWMDGPTDQLIDQPQNNCQNQGAIDWPMDQVFHWPTDKLTVQPADELTDQLINPLTNQSTTDQPNNRPTNRQKSCL